MTLPTEAVLDVLAEHNGLYKSMFPKPPPSMNAEATAAVEADTCLHASETKLEWISDLEVHVAKGGGLDGITLVGDSIKETAADALRNTQSDRAQSDNVAASFLEREFQINNTVLSVNQVRKSKYNSHHLCIIIMIINLYEITYIYIEGSSRCV